MKKILPILIAIILTSSPAFAKQNDGYLDEVILEESATISEPSDTPENTESDVPHEKTLREKLSDVYHLEVYKYDTPNFLLKDVLTKKFDEDSPLESLNLWAGYNGNIGVYMNEDASSNSQYDFNAINVGIDGKFKNNTADFRIMFQDSPYSSRNFVQSMFADMYIATNKIPHHRVMIGHTRPPVGMEGGYGPFVLPFIARSQISRNFGTIRKLGARIAGDYSFIDYDLGVYSSDTYFQEFFPGTEFIGWVNLKPLAKTGGKYGSLKIGGGLDAGNRSNSFCVAGAYIGYEYKRFMANFEWANADGYNGPSGFSTDKHASGFYATLGYMLTKKLQILARYDEFDPDKNIAHNNQREYSLGLNYFIKGQGLRLILNYVFCQNDAAKDSHRILVGTQILL